MFSKIIRDTQQYLPLLTIKSTALDSSNSLYSIPSANQA